MYSANVTINYGQEDIAGAPQGAAEDTEACKLLGPGGADCT